MRKSNYSRPLPRRQSGYCSSFQPSAVDFRLSAVPSRPVAPPWTKRQLEARLEKLQANHRKDDVVTFEQLGVDMMFVDESDNYKNLFLYTKEDIGGGIEAQKLGGGLLGQMVRHHENGLVAQSQPPRRSSRRFGRRSRTGFGRTHGGGRRW